MPRLPSLFLSLLCLTLFGVGLAAEPIDRLKPQGYVSDYAQLLTAEEARVLELDLRGVSRKGGAEIAVVTLKSLDGQSIEAAARKIFDSWKIGKAGKDNGVLLLIAMKERAIRIETGYGAETKIPDLAAGRIIRDDIAPDLARGQYQKGITRGVQALVKRLEDPHSHRPHPNPGSGGEWILLGLFLFAWLPLVALGTSFGPALVLAWRKKDVKAAIIAGGILAYAGWVELAVLSTFTYGAFRVVLIYLKEKPDDQDPSNPFNYPIFQNRPHGSWGSGGGFGGFGGGRGGGGGASGGF